MTTLLLQLRSLGRRGRRNRMVQEERGFTLVEMIVAASIFIGVAAALAGVLGSSIVVHDLARERTFAQQAATAQIECVRRLAYQDVGLWPSGNPSGKIGYTGGGDFCKASSFTISKTGFQATMVTTVDYVDDPVPTGVSSAANYKKVTVTVTRGSDGMVLASEATFVAPIQRAPYGGLNNAILNVTVADLVLSSPVQGATCRSRTGRVLRAVTTRTPPGSSASPRSRRRRTRALQPTTTTSRFRRAAIRRTHPIFRPRPRPTRSSIPPRPSRRRSASTRARRSTSTSSTPVARPSRAQRPSR